MIAVGANSVPRGQTPRRPGACSWIVHTACNFFARASLKQCQEMGQCKWSYSIYIGVPPAARIMFNLLAAGTSHFSSTAGCSAQAIAAGLTELAGVPDVPLPPGSAA